MAFIPDEAIAAMGDLTPKAFGLFVYYCKFRNPDQGDIVWPSLETIARDLDIEKPQACELRQQLLKKGWVERVQGDSMRLLKGFTPFGKTEHHSEKPNTIRKNRTPFGKTEHHSEIPNEPFGNSESHIRKNQPIEPDQSSFDRAGAQDEQREYQRRGASKQQPEIKILGKFAFDDYLRYVQAKNPEKQFAQATGLATWMRRNGQDDEAVAAWLKADAAKPARAAPRQRCGKCNGRGDYLNSSKVRVNCECPAGQEMAAMAR